MSTKRLQVSWNRFVFELFNKMKLFWLIENKINFLKIKEPFNKLYQRGKKRK